MNRAILSLVLGVLAFVFSNDGHAQISQKQAQDLAQKLDNLREDKIEDCDILNPPYFQARQYMKQFRSLEEALSAMFLYRKRYNCLIACPKGQTCPGPQPDAEKDTQEFFKFIRKELENCWADPKCTEGRAKVLRGYLKDIVIILILDHKDDPKFVSELLDQVTIVVGSAEVISRCAQVLKGHELPADEAAKILQALIDYTEKHGITADTAVAFTRLLNQLQSAEDLPKEVREKVIQSIGAILQAWVKNHNASDLDTLAGELGSVADTERLVLMIRAAQDLKDPSRTEALAAAVEQVLRSHPELEQRMKQGLPNIKNARLQEKLTALARIMNGAELADLNRKREAAPAVMLIHSSNRPLKILVARHLIEECTKHPKRCSVADAMWTEFETQLIGRSPQSGERIAVPGKTPDSIIALATKAMVDDPQSGSAVDCQDARTRQIYGPLCNHPYVAVYVFEQTAPLGANEDSMEACGKVYYAARGINDSKPLADKYGPVCATSRADAVIKARQIAADVLEQSAVSKYVTVWCKYESPVPSPTQPAKPSTAPPAKLCPDKACPHTPCPTLPRTYNWGAAGYRAAAFSGLPWFDDRKPANNWVGSLFTAAEVGLVIGGVILIHQGLDQRNDASLATTGLRQSWTDNSGRSIRHGSNMLLVGIPVTRLVSWILYGATQ